MMNNAIAVDTETTDIDGIACFKYSESGSPCELLGIYNSGALSITVSYRYVELLCQWDLH
jgi:hypothetical protein